MKLINYVTAFVLLSLNIFAQGGSSYSIFGVGDLGNSGNASYDGMGGASIANPSETGINFNNPALWSLVKSTRLQVGYRFNQNAINSPTTSLYQNNGGLNGFSALFAIDTSSGISMSLGVTPYSHVNYLLSTPVLLTKDDITLKGKTVYQGLGGISLAYLGGSTGIGYGLNLGIQVYTIFGQIQHSALTDFTEDLYGFNYGNYRKDFVGGYGIKSGLFYSGLKNFGVGIFIESIPKFKVSREVFYDSPLVSDTTVYYDITDNIPVNIGFGLSYKTGNFILASDFSTQDFSNFTYQIGQNMKFSNSYQFNFGVNRIGNQSINANTFDKISYKFGFSYKKLYYEVLRNNINETSLSLGMEIPWSTSFNSDVSTTFGFRGTNNNGLVQEYFGRLGIDISIGETWFSPFKREY